MDHKTLADTSPLLTRSLSCRCGWTGTTIGAEGMGFDDIEGFVLCPKCAEWIEVIDDGNGV